MTNGKREYYLSWLALIMLSVAALALLVMKCPEPLGRNACIIIRLVIWLLITGSGVFLFTKASKNAWLSGQGASKPEAAPTDHPYPKKTVKQTTEQLDIESVLRRSLRRLNTGESSGIWGKELLGSLAAELEIMSGLVYEKNKKGIYTQVAAYALPVAAEPYEFKAGEGLTGQAVKNRQVTIYNNIPEEYREVLSGLGSAMPAYLAIVPVPAGNDVPVVIELAGFKHAGERMEQLMNKLGRELSAKIGKEEGGAA